MLVCLRLSLRALCFQFHLTSTCWISRPVCLLRHLNLRRFPGTRETFQSVSQKENQNMDINLQIWTAQANVNCMPWTATWQWVWNWKHTDSLKWKKGWIKASGLCERGDALLISVEKISRNRRRRRRKRKQTEHKKLLSDLESAVQLKKSHYVMKHSTKGNVQRNLHYTK